MLKRVGYRPRVVDQLIEEALNGFGAVCIEGAKWCGKTWTTLNHAKSIIYIGDPTGNFQNRRLAQLNPSIILKGEEPRAIDEWQDAPQIWDAVRHEVDMSAQKGRFLLTGSSMPLQEATAHSGAGRIARIKMRPMTLAEMDISSADVSLSDLFEGKVNECIAKVTLEQIIEYVCRGGWPGSQALPMNVALQIPKQYLKAIVETDMLKMGERKRDVGKINRLLYSLARNNQTTANNKTLISDMAGDESGERGLSELTVPKYISDLEKLFIIEEQRAWNPRLRSKARIRTKAKRRFVDPSLAVAALGANPDALINDLETFGFMFEAMCIRDITVYAEALGGQVYYYADNAGLEADAIVELPDGSWGAIEVKLGANQIEKAASSLLTLKKKMIAADMKPPSFLAVFCGLSNYGYEREDGVAVVPITCFG